jgi:hypothetical protein
VFWKTISGHGTFTGRMEGGEIADVRMYQIIQQTVFVNNTAVKRNTPCGHI